MSNKILTYKNIIGSDNKIGGTGTNNKSISKDFISFALHLFFGNFGSIGKKSKMPFKGKSLVQPKTKGEELSSFNKLKAPRTESKPRPSCTNNIDITLLEDNNLSEYENELKDDILNQTYDNENVIINEINDIKKLDEWNLTNLGKDVKDSDNNDVNGVKSGLKIAILFVIKCFVSSGNRDLYKFGKFKDWLIKNDKHGIPDNGSFKVSDVICKWSIFKTGLLNLTEEVLNKISDTSVNRSSLNDNVKTILDSDKIDIKNIEYELNKLSDMFMSSNENIKDIFRNNNYFKSNMKKINIGLSIKIATATKNFTTKDKDIIKANNDSLEFLTKQVEEASAAVEDASDAEGVAALEDASDAAGVAALEAKRELENFKNALK